LLVSVAPGHLAYLSGFKHWNGPTVPIQYGLNIPLEPSLLGIVAFCQAVFVSTTDNGLQFALTGALAIALGV